MIDVGLAAVPAVIVGRRMPLDPERARLDQRRALSRPGPLHRLSGDLFHREHVVPVDEHTRKAIRVRLLRNRG